MLDQPLFALNDDSLILYAELSKPQIRAVQRRLKTGELARIAPGMASGRPPDEWPALIAQHRTRVLAALFPGAVIGMHSAFRGGVPVDGVMHLNYSYNRKVALPGLQVLLFKSTGKAPGDLPIAGKDIYFPSTARLLLENLASSRGAARKTASRADVEERLVNIRESRGEATLAQLRDGARTLAPALGLAREATILDGLVGSLLGTHPASKLSSPAAKAWAAGLPYDPARLALFEVLASAFRAAPLEQPAEVATTKRARTHFAFLESYFSNFIEGTEFDIAEARAFVLQGRSIEARPKDSHDILGVFRQAVDPAWSGQCLAPGPEVLAQLRARHADQMRERPEVAPGDFKDRENFAGGTAFVRPQHVRGTLVEGTKLLPSVELGAARALLAMFIVAEVHPFIDGNGRLARLAMNAELSAAKACRIIVPTLFRDEYLDCLRALSRNADPAPYIAAMQKALRWSAAFDYEDLDQVIASMRACNAFERSRVQHQLLFPASTTR